MVVRGISNAGRYPFFKDVLPVASLIEKHTINNSTFDKDTPILLYCNQQGSLFSKEERRDDFNARL